MEEKPAEIIEVGNKAPLAPIRIFFSLVYLRKRDNVTQQTLADELDISRQHLSAIESGKRKPNPELLQKIAKRFEMSVDEFDIEPWTVEMAKQMLAEDVASMYYGDGELSRTKDDRLFLLRIVQTLTPQILIEEKVTTHEDEDGRKIREKVERKLAQHGIPLPKQN